MSVACLTSHLLDAKIIMDTGLRVRAVTMEFIRGECYRQHPCPF